MRSRISGLALVLVSSVAVSSFFLNRAGLAGSVEEKAAGAPQQFTPAHPTVLDAVREFLGWRDNPVQPFAFTHQKHAENQIACTTCHKGVNQGPIAGIPNINVCMRCHTFFAKDRPEIKKLTAIFDSGLDLRWPGR